MNSPPNSDDPAKSPGAVTRILKIVNEKGLHARASAKFVADGGEVRRDGDGLAQRRERRAATPSWG